MNSLNGFVFEARTSTKGSKYIVASGNDGKYFANLAVGLNGELGLKLSGMTDQLTGDKPNDVTIVLGV